MRYSIESKERKYIKGYGHLILSFAIKFGDKYSKKLMDDATKTAKKFGTDAAKIASKGVIQKTAEATGGLTGSKIAEEITSIGKSKSNKKIRQIKHQKSICYQKNVKKLLMI